MNKRRPQRLLLVASAGGLLIAYGSDVNAKDQEGNTPLISGLPSADLGVVQVLIANGADVKARNKDGDTPLTAALSQDKILPVTIRLLLEHGADPNVRTKDGRSAPQLARKCHRPDILAMLRRAGAKQ